MWRAGTSSEAALRRKGAVCNKGSAVEREPECFERGKEDLAVIRLTMWSITLRQSLSGTRLVLVLMEHRRRRLKQQLSANNRRFSFKSAHMRVSLS